jgi:predicted restriction endonuclease
MDVSRLSTGAYPLTAQRRFIDNLSIPRVGDHSLCLQRTDVCTCLAVPLPSHHAYFVTLSKLSDEELATIGHIWGERPTDIALTAEALTSLSKDSAQELLDSLQKVSDQRIMLVGGCTHQNLPVSRPLTNTAAESLR